MLARAVLLALLPLACVTQGTVAPEHGKQDKPGDAPMLHEPSAPSSETKAAVPPEEPPNEQKTAEEKKATSEQPQPATAPR